MLQELLAKLTEVGTEVGVDLHIVVHQQLTTPDVKRVVDAVDEV